MDHFGLRSVKDLPKLKDIQPGSISEIGLPADMMDAAPEDEPVNLQGTIFDAGGEEDVVNSAFSPENIDNEASGTDKSDGQQE